MDATVGYAKLDGRYGGGVGGEGCLERGESGELGEGLHFEGRELTDDLASQYIIEPLAAKIMPWLRVLPTWVHAFVHR